MHLSRIQRISRLRYSLLIPAAFLMATLPAHAASKEIIELQTQVQQLMDQMQRLQSTVDSRFGLVQHLVEQSTDSVNQMNQAVSAMQQKLNAQGEGTGGKLDSLSGQVQSLNDSLDELKTRIGKLDKQMQDIQSQLQNVQAQPAGGAPPAGAGSPTPSGFAGNLSVPPGAVGASGAAGAGGFGGNQAGGGQAPPLQETYQGALRDYNAAHYDVAASEFGDVLHYYPNDDLAGNAQFYLGEIAYKQQKYHDAVKAYNNVLESFSGSPKAPAAQLHKGFSLLQLSQREAGVHELRSLIQRYPQTPEAVQARSKLNGLGVRVTTTATR